MKYEISGTGTPVILIHGLFGSRDNLKTLAKDLEDQFQVIRIDLPNHGDSEHWQTMTYPDLVNSLVDLIDQLDLPRPAIVGHSLGGKLAMACALSYPKIISRICVIDIAPVTYPLTHQIVFNALTSLKLSKLETRKQALEHLLSFDIDLVTAQFLLKNLLQNSATNSHKPNKFFWKINLQGLSSSYPILCDWPYDNVDEVENNSYVKPTLFIKGGDSDYIQPQYKQAILSQFPNAMAKTIASTGHWPHSEKPPLFNRIVKDFLITTDN